MRISFRFLAQVLAAKSELQLTTSTATHTNTNKQTQEETRAHINRSKNTPEPKLLPSSVHYTQARSVSVVLDNKSDVEADVFVSKIMSAVVDALDNLEH